MVPLGERFAALREAADEVPATHPAGLTDREVEVLRLVADGMTNREIGEALFISENTVIRHVSNIFSKTGSSNRAEATAYAVRQGVAED